MLRLWFWFRPTGIFGVTAQISLNLPNLDDIVIKSTDFWPTITDIYKYMYIYIYDYMYKTCNLLHEYLRRRFVRTSHGYVDLHLLPISKSLATFTFHYFIFFSRFFYLLCLVFGAMDMSADCCSHIVCRLYVSLGI